MHASQCVDLFFLVRFVVSWLDRHGEEFSVFSDGKRLLVLTCANSRPIFDSPAIIPVEAHTRQFKQFRAFVLRYRSTNEAVHPSIPQGEPMCSILKLTPMRLRGNDEPEPIRRDEVITEK
jgi:hypothetical protein